VANEFLEDDVNRFARLATSGHPVGGLAQAARAATQPSRRARDILAPLHLGDELRAALTVGGACWGCLCLHREAGGGDFTAAESAALITLAPYLAAGLRQSLLVPRLFSPLAAAGPGVVVLDANLALVALTPSAEQWLDEVDAIDWPSTGELPAVLGAVAAQLQALDSGETWPPEQMPRARLRTRAGRWVVVHAAPLRGLQAAGQIAIIIEEAKAPEVVPLVGRAYGLSTREWEVTQLVLRGQSTTAIVAALSIASTTVQDHLKAIFEKVGVHSQRSGLLTSVSQILTAKATLAL
jgi:DNA-binding CsgD family transcriptional regulator